uniref:Uncharacterized protein AlNc14C86G5535 n=1 Tax=Albugo laibachii Nc14 TaxID=890382 RepID=F0WG02_9STRA|nr:conserved unknown protein putative [Albugo laibachii Nc14]|eukprot:CCA20136.1 conserved unknown protein putative [Albugo laibachii Nc14]
MALLSVAFIAVTWRFFTLRAVQTNITNVCSPSTAFPPVVQGELTWVCININNEFRAVFTPTADKFSVISIRESWNDSRIGGNPEGASVSVSSLGNRTLYKRYAHENVRFPYLTAIISVKQGLVQGVTWDDGCFFCSRDACLPNLYSSITNTSLQLPHQGFSCYTNTSICNDTVSACDLTIYIGWTGTDKDGNYLSSAGLRMSQFQKFSFASYYSSIKTSLSNFWPGGRFQYGE